MTKNRASTNLAESNEIPLPGTPSTEPHPHTNYERQDDRWRIRFHLRDWLFLLLMIGVYLVWTGVLYFFEPGIR